MSARDILIEAADEARVNSFNGMNKFRDAMADWWLGESQSHFHLDRDDPESIRFVYDMPGMEDTPAVRAARAYLAGDAE